MDLRGFYLLMTVLGVLLPAIFIWIGLSEAKWDVGTVFSDVDWFFHSALGRMLASGYFLSGVSLSVLALYESNARSDYYLLWALPIVLFFGIGAALPFYLFLRMPRRG